MVMGDRHVIVWGQFVLRVKFIPSSLPMAHTNMYTCMTWCTFTECLFFFFSSICSESGPVCAVS